MINKNTQPKDDKLFNKLELNRKNESRIFKDSQYWPERISVKKPLVSPGQADTLKNPHKLINKNEVRKEFDMDAYKKLMDEQGLGKIKPRASMKKKTVKETREEKDFFK